MTEDNGAKTEGAEVPMESIDKKIAKILRDNIKFSGQIDGYVIHGAIEKIKELCDIHDVDLEAKVAISSIQSDLAAAKESIKELLPYVYSVLEREKDMGNTFLKGTYAEQIQAKMDRAKKLLAN
jgi:hypothetical protein